MFPGVGVTCLALAMAARPEMPLLEADPAGFDAPAPAVERSSGKPDSWLTEHPTIRRMMTLENDERARYGLPPLKMNTQLCLLAQQHAQWMADTGYYTHSNFGIPEIIHSGPASAEDAVQGWIYSPAHHSIMLSGSEAGFGYAVRNGIPYWVTLVQ